QVDARMAFEHARGGRVDRSPVGDVALLVLVGVGRAARQRDRVPALPAKLAHQLGAAPRGGAGDDCDAHQPQTLTRRLAVAVRPFASTSVTVSACSPVVACHVVAYTPAALRVRRAIVRPWSANTTCAARAVELPTASSCTVRGEHPPCGDSQVTAGPFTTFSLASWNVELGRRLPPTELTFFVSW